MKKLSIFLCVICVFMLTGCDNITEIDKRSVVQLIGIDKDEDTNGYKVSMQIFSPTGLIAGGESQVGVNVVEGQGKTIFEAIKDVEVKQGKKIFLGHMKLILLGESIKQDNIEIILEYFTQNEVVYPGIDIAYVDGTALEIVELDIKTGFISSQTLEDILELTAKDGYGINAKLFKAVSACECKSDSTIVPIIKKVKTVLKPEEKDDTAKPKYGDPKAKEDSSKKEGDKGSEAEEEDTSKPEPDSPQPKEESSKAEQEKSKDEKEKSKDEKKELEDKKKKAKAELDEAGPKEYSSEAEGESSEDEEESKSEEGGSGGSGDDKSQKDTEIISVIKTAILKDGKVIAEVDRKDTAGIKILTDEVKNMFFNVKVENRILAIIGEQFKTKLSIKLKDGKINIYAKISFVVNEEDLSRDEQDDPDEYKKKIQKRMKETVQEYCESVTELLLKKYSTDVFRIEKLLQFYEIGFYNKIKDNYDAILKDVVYHYDIKCAIK